MKTHRPWQPHMDNPPQLFNPYTPPIARDTTLDHFNIAQEDEEAESSSEQSSDQAGEPPSVAKQE